MSAQPSLAVIEHNWDRLTWNARRRAIAELAREERARRETLERLDRDIADRRAEKDSLEARIDTLRDALDKTLPIVDLRSDRTRPRVIWGDDTLWTPAELKQAHAAYTKGARDEWSVVGHRIWDKQYRRTRQNRCPDCGGTKALGSQRCAGCRRYRQTRGQR